jgi:hypothetical protein
MKDGRLLFGTTNDFLVFDPEKSEIDKGHSYSDDNGHQTGCYFPTR